MKKHNINDPDYDKILRMLQLRRDYLILDHKEFKYKIDKKHLQLIEQLSRFYDDDIGLVIKC